MKKFVAVLFLLLCTASSIYGQKTRWGQEPPYAKKGVDYPIKVHISEIHFRTECTGYGDGTYCSLVIYADTVVNGKKIELAGGASYSRYKLQLHPGDYDARTLKTKHKSNVTPDFETYEIRLPDQRAWRCTVTGISE